MNRSRILPTTVKNRLSYNLARHRSVFCSNRTGIEPHDVVLAGGNEEWLTIRNTNAGSCASLLNMLGIDARGQPHPHVDTIRTRPATTPKGRDDLIQGGAHVIAGSALVLVAACLALIGFAAVAGAAENQSDGLPEGKGKAAILWACVGCHEIEVATRNRYTEAGWRRMVNTMVERGAELSEPEIADVTAYLAKNFGKANVNTAPAAQLEEALGLTEKEALAIVSYREQNGDIKSLDQLKSVPGVSPDKIQAKAAAIAFRD